MLAGASISWRNKILSSVTLSTMKAEFICSKARNVLARTIINRFNVIVYDQPLVIREDNTECIAFSKNSGNYKKSKRIDARYHFVRESYVWRNYVGVYIIF